MPKNQNKKIDETIYLEDYSPSLYSIKHVEMDIRIEEERSIISASLSIEPRKGIKPNTPLVLDGVGLALQSISIDANELSKNQYKTDKKTLTISKPPQKRFTLKTKVIIKPQDNTDLMGLYRSNGVYCTQCEAEGFRNITFFLDRPDELATYKVRLSADKKLAPILLSNGNLIESGDLLNGHHFAIWHDPHPKPSYLFALVAGDLGKITDSFTTKSGKKVELAIYCEHGKENKCTYAMDALKRSFLWEEKRFGLEYDLDIFNIVAVSDFNFGAMENKGLNIFNDRLILAEPQTATDADYERIESVVAHEYFHNWSGNRITLKNWFQLCLKEGLTVYRDQEFTSDERSRAVKRIEDVRLLKMAQFPEDAGPLAHPARPDKYSEIDNFYTATVYEKGAEIVRMLATLLGEEEFQKGCSLYFDRHDGQATTIEAWIKVFEDSSGRDLNHFKKWYLQSGTPLVEVRESWEEASKIFTLSLKQSTKPTQDQPKKQAMLIPIKFGLIGSDGSDMNYTSSTGGKVVGDMIIFDEESVEVKFKGLANRPILSFLRGFSAPIKIISNASDSDRLFLASHDKDAFNRWQALNDISLDILVNGVKKTTNFDNSKISISLIKAIKQTLSTTELDDALKANALSIPSEKIIAQTIGKNIDPAKIHATRKNLLNNISNKIYQQLYGAYKELTKECSPYSHASKSTQARLLRNQCLALMVAGGTQEAIEIAKNHYYDADNMSDRMASLNSIVAQSSTQAKPLLKHFYDNFCSDILVYDKWLALNANSPDKNCLENVKKIYHSANFPKENPNRTRSLIGVFCQRNLAQFAQESGKGFDFVIEVILEIDKINPSLSAQLLTSFESWKSYEIKRQEKAKSALLSLKENKLSRNVFDILIRILG